MPATLGGQRLPPYRQLLVFGQNDSGVDFCKLFLGQDTRSHYKAYFIVILNEAKDLKALKRQDSSPRSE